MSNTMKNEDGKPTWSLSIGFYPGVLFGMRTYEEDKQVSHVFYIPFIDIAYEIYK